MQTNLLQRMQENRCPDQKQSEAPELPWTGERFVPGLGGEIALEHLHRYAIARSMAHDKVTLDIGCGEGYGPNLLAQVASYVVGVDVSYETIQHAMDKYRRDNLAFVSGTCANVPIATASIDLVVSFETLEHHDQHEQMISEAQRVLRARGVLIISTPDKYEYSDATGYANRFHTKELYREDFEKLLKSYFKNVTVLGQRVTSGSYVAPLSQTPDTAYRTFRGDSDNLESDCGLTRPLYIVAVASNDELPDLSVGLFEGDLLAEKDRLLAEKDRRLAKLHFRLLSTEQEMSTIRQQMLIIQQQTLAVQQTLGWKMLGWVRNILYRMLPPGTWRWNVFWGSITFLAKTTRFLAKRLHQADSQDRFARTSRPKPSRAQTHDPVTLETQLGQFRVERTRTLRFPQQDNPTVSIVLVTHNKAEYTLHCLTGLLSAAEIPFEVIIVDNASTDYTSELLERITNVIKIRNNENLQFIAACNQAAGQARGKYLLFLNNDAYLEHGALSALVNTIEQVPEAGAVGGKLVFPNGELQEAGSIIWKDGTALGYGRNSNPHRAEYCYVREVDYCSGACLLVRKDLFDRLGGFDTRYSPAYYEDSDLCMNVTALGYKVLFQPKALVIHNEFTSSTKNGAEFLMRQNQTKFQSKWKYRLESHLDPSQKNIVKARDKRAGRNILVFDDRIPTPGSGSGYPRMYAMLKFLVDLGCRVTFIPLLDSTKWEPETERLQQLGVEVLYGSLELAGFLESRKELYDTVIVSRPHNGLVAVPLVLSILPNATLIYDAEALFYRRELLRAQLQIRRPDETDILRFKESELALIRASDKIIAVSDTEKQHIVNETGRNHDIYIWGHAQATHKPSTGFSERKDLVFIGGFLSSPSPNEDAVVHFVRVVFPKIREALPDVRLIVVGANPPEAVKSLASQSVIIAGYAASLQQYYEKCRIFVNPVRYAAGVSLKLIEAMSSGIPTVVTALAATGLQLRNNEHALICATDEEFAKKTVELYQNEDLWLKVQQRALTYAEEHFQPAKLKASLAQIVGVSVASAGQLGVMLSLQP